MSEAQDFIVLIDDKDNNMTNVNTTASNEPQKPATNPAPATPQQQQSQNNPQQQQSQNPQPAPQKTEQQKQAEQQK
jgi:hypothetical protein